MRTVNWESIYGRPATDMEGFILETFGELFRASRRLLVYPQIPGDVLAEARRSYLMHWDQAAQASAEVLSDGSREASGEWLLAMGDPTVHGGGLHLGFALTTRAVYWRNIGQAPASAWIETMKEPEIRGTWLDFGPSGAIDFQYLDSGTLDNLVRFLQTTVAAYQEGVPAEFVRGWFVRNGSDERGPYTGREMTALLRSGALLPYTSDARGPGMADWAPMPQIDVVAEILEELKNREVPGTSTREAFKRVAESKPSGIVRTRPEEKPDSRSAGKHGSKATGRGESKSVGQVIDGLIDSVLKRLKG